MANVLLVDPDALARRAMNGVLARGGHRFAAVDGVDEAWAFLRDVVKVDLVFVELSLKGQGGLSLIERLKSDVCLKRLPVAVYAARGDRESVKRVLSLRAQNFLLKPYRDEAVFAEIARAMERPWRETLFESDEAFAARTGLSADKLRAALERLRAAFQAARALFPEWAEKQEAGPAIEVLDKLVAKSAGMGALGPALCARELRDKVAAANWSGFIGSGAELLDFPPRLIASHLRPDLCPEAFQTEEEKNSEGEAQARAAWERAPAENRCPMVDWPQLQRQIDALPGCPVVDSIAASFQMSANGHPTSLSPLLDLVQRDPGLTAEVLIAANRLKRSGEDNDALPIEEPRMAVGMLGELRLATLGGGLVSVQERLLLAPPRFSWPAFRMFQLGSARLARWVCGYLDLPSIEAAAYTAGLMHDLGKLLLVRLHPFALQAIHAYAVERGLKLAEAERFFLGATTHQMAAHFAEKQGLPARFANVMRWLDSPEDAAEDQELVAVVSFARDLCRRNNLGFSGDTPSDDAAPLEQTAEWRILSGRVYLNFDFKKFERQAHYECQQIKRELMGAPPR